jgi:hypothetical protein
MAKTFEKPNVLTKMTRHEGSQTAASDRTRKNKQAVAARLAKDERQALTSERVAFIGCRLSLRARQAEGRRLAPIRAARLQ